MKILLALLLLAATPAFAQPAPPVLAAELSQRRIAVTTAFSGGEIRVVGATERLIGEAGTGDQVLVLATGPAPSLLVRETVKVLGLWVNGAGARFNRVPAYWAIAGTAPVAALLNAEQRAEMRLGLDHLSLVQLGARGAQFRPALLALQQRAGLWANEVVPVEVSGGRLFHARLPMPSTVVTGEYRVQVLLVREGRVAARQELRLDVERTGSAAWIADVARGQPVLYGLACIVLAAFAGWLGSVLFRRV